MQRIVLPQSVFSHPTSIAASADYYNNKKNKNIYKRHKSRNIHSEALYMSMYACVVEL